METTTQERVEVAGKPEKETDDENTQEVLAEEGEIIPYPEYTPRYQQFENEIMDVEGGPKLVERLEEAETIRDYSFIVADYIQFGNTKLSDEIAIVNMNSATGCPNIGTVHCQVPKNSCYAYKAEERYPNTLPYRTRQEFLWDCLDAHTWAKAFLAIVNRKRNPVSCIRFSEAGDFRTRADILKVNEISRIVWGEEIFVYTYTASDYLPWEEAEFFVNASNARREYGDQSYIAVDSEEDIPDTGIHCPYDKTGGEIECGDCMACITGVPGDRDVYIRKH